LSAVAVLLARHAKMLRDNDANVTATSHPGDQGPPSSMHVVAEKRIRTFGDQSYSQHALAKTCDMPSEAVKGAAGSIVERYQPATVKTYRCVPASTSLTYQLVKWWRVSGRDARL